VEKLYLDHNIISYLRKNEFKELNKKVDFLKQNNQIIYSPAHIEEIAVSKMREKIDDKTINKELTFLSEISNNNELLPITREKLELVKELPSLCFERVIKDYILNDDAEKIDKDIIINANSNGLGEPKEMNNIKPEEILNRFQYKELIVLSLVNNNIIDNDKSIEALRWNFNNIKDKFYILESYINSAANVLEWIGYYREKEKKSRSRMHDVSHIIYSSYCDIFITSDKNLYMKTKAIFSLLEIKMKVILFKLKDSSWQEN
jgi:PIN domain nuclease of toxin-antitoxin system